MISTKIFTKYCKIIRFCEQNEKNVYPSIQNRVAISLRASAKEKNIIKIVPAVACDYGGHSRAECFVKQNVSKYESDKNLFTEPSKLHMTMI